MFESLRYHDYMCVQMLCVGLVNPLFAHVVFVIFTVIFLLQPKIPSVVGKPSAKATTEESDSSEEDDSDTENDSKPSEKQTVKRVRIYKRLKIHFWDLTHFCALWPQVKKVLDKDGSDDDGSEESDEEPQEKKKKVQVHIFWLA